MTDSELVMFVCADATPVKAAAASKAMVRVFMGLSLSLSLSLSLCGRSAVCEWRIRQIRNFDCIQYVGWR